MLKECQAWQGATVVLFLLALTFLVLYVVEKTNQSDSGQNRTVFEKYQLVSDKPKNLIIIVGLFRTMDTTIDYLIENVIKPNEPCHVCVVLDPRDTMSDKVQRLLAPWLLEVPKLSLKKPPSQTHVEFALSWEAMNYLRNTLHNYACILITRTDVLAKDPFRLNMVYAQNEDCILESAFQHFSRRFIHETDQLYDQKTCMKYWFLSAGIVSYAREFALNRPVDDTSVWCPPELPLSKLSEQTRELCHTIDHLNHDLPLAELLRSVVHTHKLMYVFGSTWVRFGKSADMIQHVDDLYHNYNRTFRPSEPPLEVTEAQLRLSILQLGGTLIDAKSEPDLAITFNPKQEYHQKYQKKYGKSCRTLLRAGCIDDQVRTFILREYMLHEDN